MTSFVSDIVLPFVSLLPFLNRNMDQKFSVLSEGPHYVKEEGYNTLKQARDDGALVLAYGCVLPLKQPTAWLYLKKGRRSDLFSLTY